MTLFSNAQGIIDSYKKLSKTEKNWVKSHAIAAYRVRNFTKTACDEVNNLMSDSRFDGDACGGMLDAFRHTFWMALNAQKIGYKKAIKLGSAHENANYGQFLKGELEDGQLPDSLSCRMDLLNNSIGAKLGSQNPKMSYNDLKQLVISYVLEGKCWKIKKNKNLEPLDQNNNIIVIKEKSWYKPYVLVESNYPNL